MVGAAYQRVIDKFNWAKKHIADLDVLQDGFREEHRKAVVPETDPNSGEVHHRLTYIPEIPADFPFILGDAIQNLRGALDYLAYELVISGANQPSTNTTFPVGESSYDYWERLAKQIKGMRQQSIESINRFQPYKGGFGHNIWRLNKLNNIAKHRKVIALAFAHTAISFTPSEERTFVAKHEKAQRWRGENPGGLLVMLHVGKGVIRKAGDILKTVSPAEANQNVKFRFDIAINEPEADTEGNIATFLLRTIGDQVFNIVDETGIHLPR